MMTNTRTTSIHYTDIDEDALLALSRYSGTELDYELSDSLLDSDNGKSHSQPLKPIVSTSLPNAVKLPKEILPEKQTTMQTGNKRPSPQQTKPKCDFNINADDFKPATNDILDLQRMADRFAEMRQPKRFEKIIFGKRNDFNYTVVAGTDRMLEEAHNILYKQHNKLDRNTRVNLQNSILKMMELPHLYVPMPPEKQASNRVKDWLNKHTSHPEPEMSDFTMPDPVQPRKFVTEIQPRISTSDTNVILGKRKRELDYFDEGGDNGNVNTSSSDTRISVHADWPRPCRSSKRRKIRS